MEHSRLVEKVLHEISTARTGIAANYARLWHGEPASGGLAPPDRRSDETPAAQPGSPDNQPPDREPPRRDHLS